MGERKMEFATSVNSDTGGEFPSGFVEPEFGEDRTSSEGIISGF
jgi:hypothetical protein